MFKYEREMLRAMLLNWPDIEEVTEDFRLIDMRCDVQLALSQIEDARVSRRDVATIMCAGSALVSDVNPDGVPEQVLTDLVELLYHVLNVEGLY